LLQLTIYLKKIKMLKFLFKKKLYKQLNINKIKILAIRYYNN